MGKQTRGTRDGKCDGFRSLTGTGLLYCDRETGHPGGHRDDVERVYWIETAPELEYVAL
jgi:hypothetical protein